MEKLFAERFTILLKESPMNYEQVADKLGVKSKGTISKYANGEIKNVSVSMVVKIAELFDVSPVWLIGLSNDRYYKEIYK